MTEITYRNIVPDDLNDLHEIMSHWSVVRQLGGWPWPADPAFTKSRCKAFAGNGFVWGICQNDRVIGMVGVTNAEIGYVLHPDFHGRGIVSRAARHACDHAFDKDGCAEINASTWGDNPGSAHLLGKLGFRHWRTGYERSKARGYPVITHYWRLTRRDRDSLRVQAD
ncbi:GNAT family N-acetyltransferase [Loktanella agnita]|uniref:GNAT family N-acetyltransferase n=1 Tax=Loktanella agnita TaxID=287097 RepID=UPI003986913B